MFLAAAAIAQSVVLIASSSQGGAKTGTGFAVASTPTATRILTAEHVIDGAAAPMVFVGGPRGERYAATIVREDRLRDIALLEIRRGGFPVLAVDAGASPVAGTELETIGYPSLKQVPADPQATPAPLRLADYVMVTADGKADGEAENGESILLQIAITHGDSGAPIVETSSGRVVGMVLGRSYGYGVAHWMGEDGLGLSAAAIGAFLDGPSPTASEIRPAFFVAMSSSKDPEIALSQAQLAGSARFSVVDETTAGACRSNADGPPSANAIIEEGEEDGAVYIDVTDCSGAPFYRAGMTNEGGGTHDLARLVNRAFLGYADTHAAEWTALLRFGIAEDPAKNKYLALMSVRRNPYGQLEVAHVFRGGPADIAGLAPGDAVLKIDGRPTRSLGDPFIARLLDQPSVTLLASRAEHEFTAKLALKRFAELTAHGPIPH